MDKAAQESSESIRSLNCSLPKLLDKLYLEKKIESGQSPVPVVVIVIKLVPNSLLYV